jgi:hypothetical protein
MRYQIQEKGTAHAVPFYYLVLVESELEAD